MNIYRRVRLYNLWRVCYEGVRDTVLLVGFTLLIGALALGFAYLVVQIGAS